MCPDLDVSDILLDPDFAEMITVNRTAQTVGNDGIVVATKRKQSRARDVFAMAGGVDSSSSDDDDGGGCGVLARPPAPSLTNLEAEVATRPPVAVPPVATRQKRRQAPPRG